MRKMSMKGEEGEWVDENKRRRGMRRMKIRGEEGEWEEWV